MRNPELAGMLSCKELKEKGTVAGYTRSALDIRRGSKSLWVNAGVMGAFCNKAVLQIALQSYFTRYLTC